MKKSIYILLFLLIFPAWVGAVTLTACEAGNGDGLCWCNDDANTNCDPDDDGDDSSDWTGYATFVDLRNAQTLAANDVVDGGGNTFREEWVTDGGGSSGNQVVFQNATISGADIITGNWVENSGEWEDDSIDTEVDMVIVDGVIWTEGTAGSLGAGEWDWTSADGGTLFIYGNPAALVVEAAQRDRAFNTASKNYLTLSGLTITGTNNSTEGAIRISAGGTGIIIDGCTVTKNAGYGIRRDNALLDTVTITDSHFTYNGMAGVNLGATANVNINISGSEFSNNGWRPGYGSGSGCGLVGSITSGSVHDNTFSANGSGGTDPYEHGLYLGVSATSTVTVYNNLFSDQTKGNGLKLIQSAEAYNNMILDNEHSGIECGQNDAVNVVYNIHNNVFHGNGGTGAKEQTQGAGTISLTFNNNTLYKNSTTGQEFRVFDDIEVLTVKNNIFYATDARRTVVFPTLTGTVAINNNIHWRADGNPYIYYNDTETNWATWQGLGFDAAGLNADPLLNADYTLKPGSPAKNSGDVTLDATRLQPTTTFGVGSNGLTMEDITIGAYGVYRGAAGM